MAVNPTFRITDAEEAPFFTLFVGGANLDIKKGRKLL